MRHRSSSSSDGPLEDKLSKYVDVLLGEPDSEDYLNAALALADESKLTTLGGGVTSIGPKGQHDRSNRIRPRRGSNAYRLKMCKLYDINNVRKTRKCISQLSGLPYHTCSSKLKRRLVETMDQVSNDTKTDPDMLMDANPDKLWSILSK